jgi:predicted permease
MDTLIQNIRLGFRLLMKNRGFSIVAILTLAVGIGANTAIFSLVNSVLLRTLKYKNADELVWIWSSRTDRDRTNFSLPDFMDYKDQNRSLKQVSAFSLWSANLVNAGEPERVFGVCSSANIFQTLGIDAAIGRTLIDEDDKASSPRVVILSYGFWQRRFGGNADVLGKQLTLNDENYVVVGILPADFVFPKTEADIVVPIVPDANPLRNERASISYLRMIGRLKEGVTRQQAEADLNGIASRLQRLYPVENATKKGVKLVPLHEELVANFRLALIMLATAVGLLLLIACANLANLVLTRASTRSREMAIRLAIGASRPQLIQQLLTENVLLALIGGCFGLLLTRPLMKTIILLSPASLVQIGEMSVDGTALLFTLLISLISGVLFGLLPALSSSKENLNEELRSSGKGTYDSNRRNNVRNVLILTEVAFSLVLLIAAGLLAKSFLKLQHVSPGFDMKNLLVTRLSLSDKEYSKPDMVSAFYDQLSTRIASLPGVQSVSATSALPLSGSNVRINFTISGRPALSLAEQPITQYRMIGPNYFRTMKIPMKSGRDFGSNDIRKSEPVAIINETLANRYWPHDSPVGAHIKIDDNNIGPREVSIIGVVGDVKHTGLNEDPSPEIYLTIPQIPQENVTLLTNNMTWVIRTSTEPLSQATAVLHEIQSVNRNIPISNTKSMEQLLDSSLAPNRFNLFLLGIFAFVALILASMGIYAVISYSVAQRTQELGLRMALGARQIDLLKLVVAGSIKVVLMGVAIGIAAAFMLMRVLSNLIYGISVTDSATFVSMTLLLILVSIVASYIPARRAAKVDPIIALRSE